MKIFLTLSLVIVLLISASSLYAQNAGILKQERLSILMDSLQLTKEQFNKVKEAIAIYNEGVKATMNNSSLLGREKMVKVTSLRTSRNKALLNTLGSDRYQSFLTYLKKWSSSSPSNPERDEPDTH